MPLPRVNSKDRPASGGVLTPAPHSTVLGSDPVAHDRHPHHCRLGVLPVPEEIPVHAVPPAEPADILVRTAAGEVVGPYED